MQITPDALAPKLTTDFLVKQPIDWLIRFIQYAMQGAQSLRKVPFIRLESGNHVPLPSTLKPQPSAWFAPEKIDGLDLTVFPLVHSQLTANKAIKDFLEKENVRPIDSVAIVIQSILPRYKGEKSAFNEHQYRRHLKQICDAYSEAETNKAKSQLTNSLNEVAWIACVDANDKNSNKITWKKPTKPLESWWDCCSQEKELASLFERNDDMECWFNGLDSVEAYFPHNLVVDELKDNARHLTKSISVLTQKLCDSQGDVPISNYHYKHYRGLDGFCPYATVIGLQAAFELWNIQRANILWNILLTAPLIISGYTQKESNKLRLNGAEKICERTQVGKFCIEQDWLPDQAGNLHKPNELFLVDLPATFDTSSISAKEVAEKLGMRKPEVEQAAVTLAKGDPRKQKLLEQIANASDDELTKFEKLVPRTVPILPAPSFKDGLAKMARPQRGMSSLVDANSPHHHPVSNTDRYQDKLKQVVADGVQGHATTQKIIRFSPVRDQPSNKEARQTLYQEYQGYCQVTGETFPKASDNANGEAENYFEVCSLLPYGNADYLNDAGNMLCVSADTMAKLNHASFEWLDSIEHKIKEFDNGGKAAQEIKIRIRLAGEECTIAWSQRHFMRLVTLYQKA